MNHLAHAESFRENKCARVHCKTDDCGCNLLKSGWKEVASCNRHQWNYLIEKNGKLKQCAGIDGRGGPVESPCISYAKKIEDFKSCEDETK